MIPENEKEIFKRIQYQAKRATDLYNDFCKRADLPDGKLTPPMHMAGSFRFTLSREKDSFDQICISTPARSPFYKVCLIKNGKFVRDYNDEMYTHAAAKFETVDALVSDLHRLYNKRDC